jgi:hypothetical protein
MLKRLLIGLFTGFAIGAIVAVALVQGMGMTVMGAVTAYLLAAATGALTGLIAGKPIWSKGGQIEAGLKTFFGALLSVGAMFVLRMWVHVNLDLTSFHAGAGEIGELPAAAFPLIAAILGGFFEVDNTPEKGDDEATAAAKTRVAANGEAKARVGEAEALDDEEEDEAPAKKKSQK